jgi:hypothetical protein
MKTPGWKNNLAACSNKLDTMQQVSYSEFMNNEQTNWHQKPAGWKVCPVCGCENVRAGTTHRALKADEMSRYRSLWVKKVKVGFGMDTSIEPIKEGK